MFVSLSEIIDGNIFLTVAGPIIVMCFSLASLFSFFVLASGIPSMKTNYYSCIHVIV